MAMILSRDLSNVCDQIKMAVLKRLETEPDIAMEVWIDHASDCLIIGSVNTAKSTGVRVETLLTRQELEEPRWWTLARRRLDEAVDAVKPKTNQFAEEYDEIMQAQDAMDELKPQS